jgi:lipoprotein-anchoring transpeptidase ErfK/SrfK
MCAPMRRVALTLTVVLAAAAPAHAEEVSDEASTTVPARVKSATWIRAEPEAGARRVAKLRTRTYHRSGEIVIVLSRSESGDWSQVRYPGLGNRVGWVPSRVLDTTKRVRTWLVIDRKTKRLTLWERGKRRMVAPVGVGAPGSPTPAGAFYVREVLWTPNPGGSYGPVAFGLSAYSRHRTNWAGGGQVGVHGTNRPGLIPGRISNGCVRMRNRDIRRLERLMPVGTPVEIR